MPYQEAGINIMSVLEGYSLWQVLMQLMMNPIQEFDGTDREATILWLDNIKAIARKMCFNPLEVHMSKLKGTALSDVNTVTKDGNFSWFQCHQLLIEHYSNVLYMSHMLNTYAHLVQGETKLVTQYLAGAKVLWEHIHHTSKMCDIAGSGYDNLYLVQGLHLSHIWWWVASDQDTWWSMEDVFQMIDHVTRIMEQNRVFFKPNFKQMQPSLQVNEVNLGKATWYQQVYDHSHNGHSLQVLFSNNFRDNNRQ